MVNFELILASRAAEQEQQEARQAARQGNSAEAIRQLAGNAPQNLSLLSALTADTDTGAGIEGMSGAALPSIANNSDFGDESVAITGQAGQVSALAGVDMDRLRDAVQTIQVQGGLSRPGRSWRTGCARRCGRPGRTLWRFRRWRRIRRSLRWRRIRRGRRLWRRRRRLWRRGGGGGFGGGGRGNFRNFNPGQPHGAIAWNGTNSIFNAQPFSLQGQPQVQPANGTNQFTISFMSAPYIPHLTKPSGKDTVFLTLSGSRSSTPDDFYANVPTDAERAGNFTAAGLPTIYNPVTGQQFRSNGTPNVHSAHRRCGSINLSAGPGAVAVLP